MRITEGRGYALGWLEVQTNWIGYIGAGLAGARYAEVPWWRRIQYAVLLFLWLRRVGAKPGRRLSADEWDRAINVPLRKR